MFEGAAEVRLADGSGRCDGRVEVKHRGRWGTVCHFGWDKKDAEVVCKQLGCGAVISAVRSKRFVPGSGPIWMAYDDLRGTESALSGCPHGGWDENYCTHADDARVTCAAPGFVRLVGGDNRCSGRVEINDGHGWKSVCDSHFGAKVADVVCRGLQCGRTLSVTRASTSGEGTGPIWDRELQCVGNESTLSSCPMGWLQVVSPRGRYWGLSCLISLLMT
ncbi:hypothetical protein CIB84_017566 [Bambusicola thoracicus]|uniref:SRCR domain-containing protein n=1 Tax=Bambusicola thoracicus TaxID=9083 RepID=A0A2P4S3H9_BAMTH|nr:hypothetical protein CIB84_017566 [Bambusicola thoracicus]